MREEQGCGSLLLVYAGRESSANQTWGMMEWEETGGDVVEGAFLSRLYTDREAREIEKGAGGSRILFLNLWRKTAQSKTGKGGMGEA